MKQKLFFHAAVVLSAVFCAACGTPREYRLTEKDSGRALNVRFHDTIYITLESNPTTGYSWKENFRPDGILYPLKTDAGAFQPPDARLVGAPGKQTFAYRVIEDGATGIRLEYRRPWEPRTVRPAASFDLLLVAAGKPVHKDTPLMDSGEAPDTMRDTKGREYRKNPLMRKK